MHSFDDAPGPIAEPPPDIGQRRLPIITLSETTWFRGHKAGRDPLYFNRDPAGGRFNASGGEFGVLYVGETDTCAFAEAFCHNERLRIVTEAALSRSCLCPIATARPVRIVDLSTGAGLRWLGADARSCSGPWTISQRWARALWQHAEEPDGILYRSRVAPELRAIALFDRAAGIVTANCAGNILTDRHRLGQILDDLDVALI
ncbi:MAG TPA: RES family NAD+ phosphorylase [Thermomicrobiales bacterium]|nr:RES family NAD+ phosphorylase [Thermomicrobiales bacterium]